VVVGGWSSIYNREEVPTIKSRHQEGQSTSMMHERSKTRTGRLTRKSQFSRVVDWIGAGSK
jgi:hypothetical protein